jgi:hypothetical protein
VAGLPYIVRMLPGPLSGQVRPTTIWGAHLRRSPAVAPDHHGGGPNPIYVVGRPLFATVGMLIQATTG